MMEYKNIMNNKLENEMRNNPNKYLDVETRKGINEYVSKMLMDREKKRLHVFPKNLRKS